MTGKQEVFQFLSEHKGEYLSGEELASRLHISRNAVWKAMEALRADGHVIEAVTRRGYRLIATAGEQRAEGSINAEEILAAVQNKEFPPFVTVLEETDSTNRVAKELAAKGAPEGTLVVAVSQSGGRGRMGRSFYSPSGGIYMSLLLRPKLPAQQAVLLTTAAAVAVARAIEGVTGVVAGIKWVNDLYVAGKKVCGILTEAGIDFETGMPEYVVIGIGINVNVRSLPEELVPIVGFLEETAEKPVNKSELVAAVWDEFTGIYPHLSTDSYMEEYRSRSILKNREVTVLDPSGNYAAVVREIDTEGHLVVEKDGKCLVLSSGEVSVRL